MPRGPFFQQGAQVRHRWWTRWRWIYQRDLWKHLSNWDFRVCRAMSTIGRAVKGDAQRVLTRGDSGVFVDEVFSMPSRFWLKPIILGPSDGSTDFKASSSKSIRSTRRSPYINVLRWVLGKKSVIMPSLSSDDIYMYRERERVNISQTTIVPTWL